MLRPSSWMLRRSSCAGTAGRSGVYTGDARRTFMASGPGSVGAGPDPASTDAEPCTVAGPYVEQLCCARRNARSVTRKMMSRAQAMPGTCCGQRPSRGWASSSGRLWIRSSPVGPRRMGDEITRHPFSASDARGSMVCSVLKTLSSRWQRREAFRGYAQGGDLEPVRMLVVPDPRLGIRPVRGPRRVGALTSIRRPARSEKSSRPTGRPGRSLVLRCGWCVEVCRRCPAQSPGKGEIEHTGQKPEWHLRCIGMVSE
jgi:hypothetical protein